MHALLQIEPADLDDRRLAGFLQAHLDDLAPTAPPESRHALDLDGLRAPGVRLWVALDGDQLVGTAGSAPVGPSHEEVKSMRTHPDWRGRGVARRLLTRVVDDARQRGISRLSLETGSMEFFAPARALYAASGFTPCPPFGPYRSDPNSAFMSRTV